MLRILKVSSLFLIVWLLVGIFVQKIFAVGEDCVADITCSGTWLRCNAEALANPAFINNFINTKRDPNGNLLFPKDRVTGNDMGIGAGWGCFDPRIGGSTGCYCCACDGTCGNNPQPLSGPADTGGANQNNAFNNPLPTPPALSTGNYFQTKGGSAVALNGSISSWLPYGSKFSLDGEGGSPGIPMSNGASSFGSGTVSSTGWIAGDDINSQGVVSDKISYRNDVDYIKSRILANIKPTVISGTITTLSNLTSGTPYEDGVYYVQTEGNADIYADLSNMGNTRVVLLSSQDINIYQKIKFTGGTGLFAAIATRDINIDPIVGVTAVDPDSREADLMGIYMAQQNINTGGSIRQLRVDGVVVGINKINLQRELVSEFPAEYFVFRPDIVLNLPKALLRQNHLWKEANP